MNHVRAPMAGAVLRVTVAVGDTIQIGDEVAVIESMKMEIPVTADGAGTVTAVQVAPGDVVDQDDSLITYE